MDKYNKIEALSLSPCDDSLPAKLLQEVFDYRLQESRQLTNQVYKSAIDSSDFSTTVLRQVKKKYAWLLMHQMN